MVQKWRHVIVWALSGKWKKQQQQIIHLWGFNFNNKNINEVLLPLITILNKNTIAWQDYLRQMDWGLYSGPVFQFECAYIYLITFILLIIIIIILMSIWIILDW